MSGEFSEKLEKGFAAQPVNFLVFGIILCVVGAAMEWERGVICGLGLIFASAIIFSVTWICKFLFGKL